ncbi:MAG: hypothetical protein N3E36_06565 [Sulfolobales archaeon]|nr:hypothetical protein [Sulfolobales archaeon]
MGSSRSKEAEKKLDIVKLLTIVPPASELKQAKAKVVERRVRVIYDDQLSKDVVRISQELASEIGVSEGDLVEVVVGGKKKFMYKVLIASGIQFNTVLCNSEELKLNGVANNSIATIRRKA